MSLGWLKHNNVVIEDKVWFVIVEDSQAVYEDSLQLGEERNKLF